MTVDRYLHLLEKHENNTERILALTFTEKAAGEMEDRVVAKLPTGTYDFWITTFHGFCQRLATMMNIRFYLRLMEELRK